MCSKLGFSSTYISPQDCHTEPHKHTEQFPLHNEAILVTEEMCNSMMCELLHVPAWEGREPPRKEFHRPDAFTVSLASPLLLLFFFF